MNAHSMIDFIIIPMDSIYAMETDLSIIPNLYNVIVESRKYARILFGE